MPLSNAQKQAALRTRRAALGQKGRLIYLTENEFKQIKEFISRLRKKDK